MPTLADLLYQQQNHSVTKAQSMVVEHMMSDDESSLTASFGVGSDSFHWGLMDIVPPKNTTQVENPGTDLDKKKRKSKAFRKYEAQLQLNQPGRSTLVQTTVNDNNDFCDTTRSAWFV